MSQAFAFLIFALEIVVIVLLDMAFHVFLGFCVYYDAQYRRDKNALLWGVLSGFFSIAALVYIIIAKTSHDPYTLWCARCGQLLTPDSAFCPRCGKPLSMPTTEEQDKYNKQRKFFLVLWIASLAAVFILSFISVFFLIFAMAS